MSGAFDGAWLLLKSILNRPDIDSLVAGLRPEFMPTSRSWEEPVRAEVYARDHDEAHRLMEEMDERVDMPYLDAADYFQTGAKHECVTFSEKLNNTARAFSVTRRTCSTVKPGRTMLHAWTRSSLPHCLRTRSPTRFSASRIQPKQELSWVTQSKIFAVRINLSPLGG